MRATGLFSQNSVRQFQGVNDENIQKKFSWIISRVINIYRVIKAKRNKTGEKRLLHIRTLIEIIVSMRLYFI